jgi:hypothetical protein
VNDKKSNTAEDRRQGDRRKGGGALPGEERRKIDRRAAGKESDGDA